MVLGLKAVTEAQAQVAPVHRETEERVAPEGWGEKVATAVMEAWEEEEVMVAVLL